MPQESDLTSKGKKTDALMNAWLSSKKSKYLLVKYKCSRTQRQKCKLNVLFKELKVVFCTYIWALYFQVLYHCKGICKIKMRIMFLLYLFEFSDNLSEWKASFRSNTERTLHFELPNTENMSLTNGYAKLFLAILTFKCLKSVTTLLSLVNFLLINITGLEYAENPSFNIPK